MVHFLAHPVYKIPNNEVPIYLSNRFDTRIITRQQNKTNCI